MGYHEKNIWTMQFVTVILKHAGTKAPAIPGRIRLLHCDRLSGFCQAGRYLPAVHNTQSRLMAIKIDIFSASVSACHHIAMVSRNTCRQDVSLAERGAGRITYHIAI